MHEFRLGFFQTWAHPHAFNYLTATTSGRGSDQKYPQDPTPFRHSSCHTSLVSLCSIHLATSAPRLGECTWSVGGEELFCTGCVTMGKRELEALGDDLLDVWSLNV